MMNEYPKIQMTWSRKDTFDGTISNITVRGETIDECVTNVQRALEEASKIKTTQQPPVPTAAPYSANRNKTEGVAEGVGKCPQCGSQLQRRFSKVNGKYFFGCSNYPACKYTRPA